MHYCDNLTSDKVPGGSLFAIAYNELKKKENILNQSDTPPLCRGYNRVRKAAPTWKVTQDARFAAEQLAAPDSPRSRAL